MKFGIYRYDKGYWTSCGWSLNRSSAQWMSEPDAKLKIEQMRADGFVVTTHPKVHALI